MTRYETIWRSLQSRPFIPAAVAWDAEHPWNSLHWRVKTIDTFLPPKYVAAVCGLLGRNMVAIVRKNDTFSLPVAVDPKTRKSTHEPKEFKIVSLPHG